MAIDFFGADHIMFGTDFPFGPDDGERWPLDELRNIRTMAMDEEDRSKILYRNAQRLLKLPSGAAARTGRVKWATPTRLRVIDQATPRRALTGSRPVPRRRASCGPCAPRKISRMSGLASTSAPLADITTRPRTIM